MPTARERYLAAVSPKSGDGSPSSVGVSSTVQNFKAAGNAAAAPPAPSPRWASRNGKASRSSTSEMTSPALTPRGPGMLSPRAAALAGSGSQAQFKTKASGRTPSVVPSPSTSTAAAGGSKRAEMSPARAAAHAASANRRAPSGNNNNSSSGNNTSSSAVSGSSSSRAAVEARLSAARAIYAGAASASAGPVSDDDYFAADGTLDADRVISPSTSADANANANAVNVMSPTNAVNARLSGAAPPPTLGEIESHMYLSSDPDSPDSAAAATAPVANNRTETKEEGGGREGKFFDESFEGAFPSVDTSIDGGRSRGNRRNPPSSAEWRTNKANRDRDVLHDPFGTMPSLPTPTKASSTSSGAAAAPPKQQPPQPQPASASTSVAAKRRAKAARSNLTVHTGGHLTSPTAANTHGVSPTSMLDFALLGTPVAAAGYSNDNDEEEAEGEGVLGAAPSPRGWKGGNASGMDINTSRDGLIGSDDLSPSNNNATSMLSDAIDSLERAHASRETEEKKSRFLSKMIMRGKKEKKSKTPRVMPSPGPEYHEVGSDPMASDRSNVADSSQMADDPPLDIVDVDDDSSDVENNLIDGANKLASAMMALLGGEGPDNASGGVGQQPSQPKRAAATTAAGGEGGSGAADPFDFSPIGGGGISGATRDRGALDAPSFDELPRRSAPPPPTADPTPQPSYTSFADKFAQRGMDRRASAQKSAVAANVGGSGISQPSLSSSRSLSADSPNEAKSHRREASGRGLRTLSSTKKTEKPQSILKNGAMTPPRKVAPVAQKPSQPDLNDPNLDPIQRAGIRLLSAAAIPIQTEVRRYLAQRRTRVRVRALVRIQSHVRRWRAERNLRLSLESVTKIQAGFRGWVARDTLEDEHYCATQLQRIVRGHIASVRVYKMLDELRRHQKATVIQSAWRTYSAQLSYQFDIVDIIIVQSVFRRKAAYREAAQLDRERRTLAATKIQSSWRSYDCTMSYLHTLADVLIAQSAVRRWMAMKAYPAFREQRYNDSATQIQRLVRGHLSRNKLMFHFSATDIQAVWRGYVARRDYQEMREYIAAVEIQRAWRGFQSFTDYVFTIADVVIAQRTARQWLAKRRVKALREVKAATTIQAAFRGYNCHMAYLYSLVNVIIVQSVVRKWLHAKEYPRKLEEHKAAVKIQSRWRGHNVRYQADRKVREGDAAIVIQKTWRGFWQYSEYIIMSHEVRRLQALCRGYRVRADLSVQRESATTIQAVARRYFATNQAEQRRQAALALATAVERMRSKNAALKVQRAWRICVIRQSENEAARIIQRFFIFVKKEVDRELARMAAIDEKKKKQQKKERKRRTKKEKDEKLLERAWLTTVDENEDETTRGSIKKTPTRRSSSKKKVASSTPDRSRSDLPPPARLTIDADDHTEVSGITNATFSSPSRFKNMSRQELKDDLSLEEAWIDTEVHQAKEKMRSERDYIKRHGLTPTRESSSGRKSRPTDSPSIRDNKKSSHRRTGSQSSSRSKGVDPSGTSISKQRSSSTQQRSSSRRQRSSSRTRREAPMEP